MHPRPPPPHRTHSPSLQLLQWSPDTTILDTDVTTFGAGAEQVYEHGV